MGLRHTVQGLPGKFGPQRLRCHPECRGHRSQDFLVHGTWFTGHHARVAPVTTPGRHHAPGTIDPSAPRPCIAP